MNASDLNPIIDIALLQPAPAHSHALAVLMQKHDAQRLIERVRRRATLLSRQRRGQARQIIESRDRLIMALHGHLAPLGFANAWCDGSSIKHNTVRYAGIGVVLFDAHEVCVTQISRYIGGQSAFDAEIAALVAALQSAATNGIKRLRIHTDSKALGQLWHEKRDDARLAPIRSELDGIEQLQIRVIPRLHNQVANALAKQAALEKSSIDK
jgi:ribonuclease HI